LHIYFINITKEKLKHCLNSKDDPEEAILWMSSKFPRKIKKKISHPTGEENSSRILQINQKLR